MSTITALQWRYSLKQFSDQTVDKDKIYCLIEAARLSASSYGLQPYQVWVVQDRDLQQKLAEQAYDQPQVKDCSHLLVFANKTTIDDRMVDDYFERFYQQTSSQSGSLSGYADHIKSAIAIKTDHERQIWAQQQAYIALGAVLTEAAVLGIDTCPMTGFQQQAFNNILGLNHHQLNAAVICAIGHRPKSDTDPIKVRTPQQDFAHFL